jgi:hypothetical protein
VSGKISKVDARGMPVEKCARLIIKTIEKRKREAIIPA